ncbi:MAG: HD domain-containing protein [Sedimentisphaerales bacterium]|nr:HD domain-containing protein [Sedimentisphaerales bacterium]
MTSSQRITVANIQPAQQLAQVFLISQPQLRATSNGGKYIAAFLSDKTGRINSRMWQATEIVFNSLPEEGFVFVRARSEMYQNAMQLVIEEIRPIEQSKVDLIEFLPGTKFDINEMFEETKDILRQIKHPAVRHLVKAFLDDSDLMDKFCKAPAAAVLHHAWIGGLLEHTLNLLRLGKNILPLYPHLDHDIVLAGLFLHDIGKTTELVYDISFRYSDQGRMLGHLVKGTIMIEEKTAQLIAQGIDMPRGLIDSIQHIIVAHHGQREYGCPVLPATPEAFLAHYIDNIDSKMQMAIDEIAKDPSAGDWTNFVKAIDGPFYKKHNQYKV